MDKEKEFEIDGIITTPEGVTQDQVVDAMIEFVESKGWTFGGGIGLYTETGLIKTEVNEDTAFEDSKD